MGVLTGAGWPPSREVRTDRLLLREARAGDRSALVELLSSSQVFAFLGGPRPRDEVEASLSDPVARPGEFVVVRDNEVIGTVTMTRRAAARPGHVHAAGEEPELSYLFMPHVWGHGYSTEACAAVLAWTDAALADGAVVLCTQTANLSSLRLAARLGFTRSDQFVEFGAEQWFGVRAPRRRLGTEDWTRPAMPHRPAG